MINFAGLSEKKIFCRMLCLFWLSFLLPGLECRASSRPGFSATDLDFSLFKLGGGGPAVLVIGGIQGDEPGGFSAATLLVTHYEIVSGSVWVVPNLNFPSIVHRSRGLHGDMNRKFMVLKPDDPEYNTVLRIQKIITDPDVVMILNLHDGSGFYRHKNEGPLYNPARWGQCVIVDQLKMDGDFPHANLAELAERVTSEVNGRLIAPHHRYHVKNTRTSEGDKEMEKSLSWFAVRNGKSAFGVEASKEFPAEVRAFYHLGIVESFLSQAGVTFKRKLELTPKGVSSALRSDVSVTFANNIVLPLENARPRINHLPLSREAVDKAVASKPIIAVVSAQKELCVHYGNRRVTCIKPDWHEMDDEIGGVNLLVDGRSVNAGFGVTVNVRKSFLVEPIPGYRVNVIGFEADKADESGLKITRESFMPRFSLDRDGNLFRVEVYKGPKFAGMFLVRFGDEDMQKRDMLPATAGKESSLGF